MRMLKQMTIILTAALLFGCANKKDDPTKLVINNTNGAGVTVGTVTVTSTTDASKSATFSSFAANSATAAQEISFSGAVNVVCAGNTGCNPGSVTLSANQTNTITIVAGAAPTLATSSSGGGSGW
jgi:hypothetical protein